MSESLFSLWPHQEKAVCEIEKAWSNGVQRVLCQSPTGSGKSRILRTIVDNHSQSKAVIYIIAHRSTLVRQLSDEISDAGIRHGIIQSGAPYIRYRVQVCSMQTLVRRLDKLPSPELIIIDECHHIKAKSYLSIINKWSKAKLLGMTATPQRTDGSGLDDIFQHLILGESVRNLIDGGFLSDYEYYAPEQVDMSGVHMRAGEYNTSESLERVDKKFITGSAVEHYKRFADHQPAIVACVSIAHSEHVAQDFREAGYKALAVNSRMQPIEVARAIDGLRNGTLEILTQCEMLSEGVDVPGAVALIWLRPTASLIIFLQNVGRVLRRGDDKPKAIILDHVGNYTRFGLPDDGRVWSLQGRKRGAAEPSKYKRCPQCLHGDITVSSRICKHCGYQWAETEEQGERIPEEKEGQLVSVRGKGKEEQDLILAIARGGARNLRDAIRIAKSMGYKHTSAYTVWVNILRNKV